MSLSAGKTQAGKYNFLATADTSTRPGFVTREAGTPQGFDLVTRDARRTDQDTPFRLCR